MVGSLLTLIFSSLMANKVSVLHMIAPLWQNDRYGPVLLLLLLTPLSGISWRMQHKDRTASGKCLIQGCHLQPLRGKPTFWNATLMSLRWFCQTRRPETLFCHSVCVCVWERINTCSFIASLGRPGTRRAFETRGARCFQRHDPKKSSFCHEGRFPTKVSLSKRPPACTSGINENKNTRNTHLITKCICLTDFSLMLKLLFSVQLFALQGWSMRCFDLVWGKLAFGSGDVEVNVMLSLGERHVGGQNCLFAR